MGWGERYYQHKFVLGFEVQSANSRATEYASIATLLAYPFVRRPSRFSLLRSRAYGYID